MEAPEPQEQQQISSYEGLMRAPFVPSNIQEQWVRHEQRKRRLIDGYQAIAADSDLNDEAKQRRAAELEAAESPKIEREARELKQALLKSAEQAERASLPIYLGESHNPEDPTKVLIGQNEAARIHRRLERVQNMKGPLRPDTADILAEEYQKGLDMGGTRGGAIIRGVLQVAEELGVDTGGNWVPRQERHMEALDRARQRAYAASVIPTQQPVPAMPRSLQPPRRLSRRPEITHSRGPALIHNSAAPVVKQPAESGLVDKPEKKKRTKRAWK